MNRNQRSKVIDFNLILSAYFNSQVMLFRDPITSAQNPRIKNFIHLQKARERKEQNVFVLEGVVDRRGMRRFGCAGRSAGEGGADATGGDDDYHQ